MIPILKVIKMDNFEKIWEEYRSSMCAQLGNMATRMSKMLKLLHSIPFRYMIKMDRNRVANAVYYRNQWMSDHSVVLDVPDNFIMDGSCSILELLFTFALKIDREYTSEDFIDHPEIFFWEFIENLNLNRQLNSNFDEKYVRGVIDTFITRSYEADGRHGNIFIINDPDYDLRELQLWDQMQIYLTEVWYKNGR